ncbi:TPA: site-2 protease family protein [Candidatus Daviesbacteria bacterium]|nr:site-2 protease family protein [Candidatus Daviesbacteria bacterium]
MAPEFLALSIVILLFSVIVHEVMHGYVALKFGDHTAQKMGRLTLNPIPHIDPFGTILLPALILIPSLLTGTPVGPLLAWAKPVPVNPLNFSNIRKGELFVSAAGVLANFALAALCALIFHILNSLPMVFPELLGRLLLFGVRINLFLGVFNLLPIPPLDGSKVLLSQLPYNLAKQYQKLERYGFLLLLFLIFIFPTPLFLLLNFLVGLFTKILGF